MDNRNKKYLPYGNSLTEENRKKILITEISKNHFKNQKEIANHLTKILNDKISQPTVNRDLKAIKAYKSNEDGYYKITEEETLKCKKDLLANWMNLSDTKIFLQPSFFTMTTITGYEKIISSELKNTFSSYILGTIENDGFIIVFTPNSDAAEHITRSLAAIQVESD
jgi:arginine repressor